MLVGAQTSQRRYGARTTEAIGKVLDVRERWDWDTGAAEDGTDPGDKPRRKRLR